MNLKTQFSLVLFAGFVLICQSCTPTTAAFLVPKSPPVAASNVQFDNQSKGADQFLWEFGDGTTSKEETPTHQYRNSGNYPVKLTATKGTKTHTIEQFVQIAPPENCQVLLETEYGNLVIELSDETPLHRDNFVKLVEEGFYEDLLFHRVIQGFMIQGGDPNSKGAGPDEMIGTGEPAHKIPAEFVPDLAHVKGAIAAARDNNPEKASSGSQYYIVHGSNVTEKKLTKYEKTKNIRYSTKLRNQYLQTGGAPQLDQEYTVFGQIVNGFDIIDKLAKVPTVARDRPKDNLWMRLYLVY